MGPDALAMLDTGSAPGRQMSVARPSLTASKSSDADIGMRLEHVTKASRF